jgi:hypothetical protein
MYFNRLHINKIKTIDHPTKFCGMYLAALIKRRKTRGSTFPASPGSLLDAHLYFGDIFFRAGIYPMLIHLPDLIDRLYLVLSQLLVD